jgi:DNA-binding GntR family transcriptional regulator
MPAMTPDRPIAALVAELETELARLREMLVGRDEAALAVRPPSGKWSVLENLQHLTLTGLAHFSRFMPDHRDWSAFGLVQVEPRSEKQLRLAAGGSIDDLLAAWRAGHDVIVARLLRHDTPAVWHHVTRHIRHQRQHIKEIERLLRGGR